MTGTPDRDERGERPEEKETGLGERTTSATDAKGLKGKFHNIGLVEQS